MTKRVTQDNVRIKAPKHMPRPSEDEVGGPSGEQDPMHLSPLGIYMKGNGISKTAFSKAMGIAHKTTLELCSGKTMPGLVMAWEIERVTKGVVPMEAWLAMPQAKKMIASMREKQPDDVKRIQPKLDAGGFASPQEKSKTGPKSKKEK